MVIYRKLDPRLLWLITAAGLALVLYFRLVPFDVDLSGGAAAIPTRFTLRPLSLRDIPLNLLLFLPFSFGLAGLLFQSGRSWAKTTGITVLVAMAISAAIELLQVYIPARVPSVADILANGLGALLGVYAYRFVAYGPARSIVRYATLRNVGLGLLVYGLFVGLLTGYLHWSVRLGNWDDALPLSLGNENNDFRPWEGRIAHVALLDRAVSAEEAAAWLAGSPAGTLADYDLSGTAPFADVHGNLPDLNWRPEGQPEVEATAGGARVGADRWLATGDPVTAFNIPAREASAFTLAAEFTSQRERQRGPARIVSISADEGHRNITLGQQGDALSIRLRTPSSGVNGEKPEMVVAGFFSPAQTRRVILTYDAPDLTLYVDDVAQVQSVSLAPGLALFQDVAPTRRWLLPFPDDPHWYDTRYWALVVIPGVVVAAGLLGLHALLSRSAERQAAN